MTRLEYELIQAGEPIRYPEDVRRLRDAIPELRSVSDADVQRLYAEWSEYFYSASWLSMDPVYNRIDEFAEYLREDV